MPGMGRIRFGTAGIRGRFGTEIGLADAAALGSAVARLAEGAVLLGADHRISGPSLAAAAAAGAMASGADVGWAGNIPLPAFCWACRHRGKVGIYVTASHNPPEYNGFKVVWADGGEIPRDLEVEIERLALDGVVYSGDPGGLEVVRGIEEGYVEDLLRKFGRQLRGSYVLDPANGAMCGLVDEVFSRAGASTIVINGHPDGRFPGRPPEPSPENLSLLSSLVRRIGADAGFAWDGDGDRVAVVDDRGNFVAHYKVAILVARAAGAERVISSVDVGEGLAEEVRGRGGEVVEWKIGDLPSEFRRREGSGWRADLVVEPWKVMLPSWGPFFDGAAAALVIAGEIERAGGLEEALEGVPEYHQVRISIPRVGGPVAERAAARLASELGELVLGVDRTDGAKVLTRDGWILIRDSGTEPKVRVYSESKSRRRAVELADMGRGAVLAAMGGEGD